MERLRKLLGMGAVLCLAPSAIMADFIIHCLEFSGVPAPTSTRFGLLFSALFSLCVLSYYGWVTHFISCIMMQLLPIYEHSISTFNSCWIFAKSFLATGHALLGVCYEVACLLYMHPIVLLFGAIILVLS